MYVDSLTCVGIKGGESEWFRINNDVRQECFMSPWLFIVYMGAVIKRGENVYGEEGRDWRLPGLLYADDWVLCGKSEEDLRV